jgi:NleD-like pathogen effector protein (putative zinc metallopeptidase)
LRQNLAKPVGLVRPPGAKRRPARGRALRPVGTLDTDSVLDLQATAGNRAVGHLLASGPADAQAGPSGASVQRKLDTARFSKTGFRAAGIKPGARLSGQSRFADIESAIAVYEGAKSRSEELKALGGIETAVTAWQQSSFRTKKHSAKKATEEASKTTEVTALLADARRERDEIMSTMDAATLGSLGPVEGVIASVSTLAKAIGLTPAQIKVMSAADLKSRYVEMVLQPFYIARKAAASPGLAGDVVDLMFQMINVDLKTVPAGDNKDVLALIQQAGLGDRNALMHEYAPKYAQGGVSTEQVSPALPGWAASSTIAVTGNDDYRDKIKKMIPVIAGTAVGKRLLEGIGGEPELDAAAHAKNKQAVVEIKLPKVTHLQYQTPGGDVRYGNAGGAKAITFDPESDILGKPDQVGAEPWRQRDAVVGLFHELIHVYIAKIGGEEWTEHGLVTDKAAQGEKLRISHDDEKAEVRIVGIDYKVAKADKTGDVTYPFSNPALNPITENEFRKQLAQSQGQGTFLPRSTYATVAGQVPLAGGPQKV